MAPKASAMTVKQLQAALKKKIAFEKTARKPELVALLEASEEGGGPVRRS